MTRRLTALFAALAVALAGTAAASAADSPTFRGSAARTGVVDDKPLPAKPKVLWVYKQAEQFVATPVIDEKAPNSGALFVSALGPFNTAVVHALSLDPRAKDRVVWSKSSPTIKMPTVSSPALVGDVLIFGDGMHQTDGATLYAYSTKGTPLWQLDVPGKLVHMECPPTVRGGRVYTGAGDAGVLAVDAGTVVLDGREQKLADVRPALDAKFAAAVKAVGAGDEADESKLPRPAPKLLWQKGKGQWHVDAPIALSDDGKRLLVPSAYVDADKAGKRALLCLSAEDGSTLWEKELTTNPWGGATVVGDTVIVGCSSIRFDVADIHNAKGQVVAFDLNSGTVKWAKPLETASVLSPVATRKLPDGSAVAAYASTDGKIVCRDVASGNRKWTYDGDPKRPFFSSPSVTADHVLAVDLHGALVALNLADGTVAWKLDAVNDKLVQAPGIVFASPLVAGGHIYVVTNNLHNEGGDKPGAVICVGEEAEAKSRGDVKVEVDPVARTLTIPCEIAPRKLPTLKDIYPLEVVATYPTPQGQKAHETVVVFDPSVKLSDVHKQLESLGAKAGHPAHGDAPPAGSRLRVSLLIPGPTGKPRTVPIERTIVDARTNKPLPGLTWYFTGSAMRQVSPDNPEKLYGADLSGTLIAIYPVTDETLVQSNLTLEQSSVLKLEMNRNLLPDEGTPVKLRIEVE